MVWLILGIVVGLVGLGFLVVFFFQKYLFQLVAGIVGVLLGVGLVVLSAFYANGVGEAKVPVNGIDRTIAGETITEAGSGFKAPWVDFVEFETFDQELVYAGGTESPSYAGGSVSGKEITVNVGGISGGSTRANIDATFIYSIDPDKVVDIYKDARSQERFTKMTIEKTVLSVTRQVPSEYSATDFRGSKRSEAEQKITDALNERLGEQGVEFRQVTIQDVRFDEGVENALRAIEEANQAAQKAEADKRTSEVNAEKALIEAQGRAQAEIAQAQGEAEANRILTQSLTPQVLEQRRIEALQKAADTGKLIISGDSPLLQVPTQ